MIKEQDKVWLNLYIAYNCINREEMKNIEKITEEQNKVLREKFEKVMKSNNKLERSIMESMINNIQLNKEIIGLRIDKITLEKKRTELDYKIKKYINRERKGNNKTKWSNNKEKEQLSKKKMHEVRKSNKEKMIELRRRRLNVTS